VLTPSLTYEKILKIHIVIFIFSYHPLTRVKDKANRFLTESKLLLLYSSYRHDL